MGGAEMMIGHLVEELVLRGTRVTVLSLWPSRGTSIGGWIESAGAEVIYLGKKPGLDWSIIRRLGRALDELRPDIVHAHRMAIRYVLPWAIRRKPTPVIHTLHTLAANEGTKADRVLLGHAYRLGRVRGVACGAGVAESVARTHGFEPSVVRNGIDVGARTSSALSRMPGPLRLVTVARFHPVKNHSFLIEALHGLDARGVDFTADLIGDGETLVDIQAKVEGYQLANKVRFVGAVSDVGEYLDQADIFVLTSHREGSPLSVMEAMARGLPVVAPAVGGLPELLGPAAGWLFEPGDQSALIQILHEVDANREAVHTKGAAALARAATAFHRSRMAMGYLEIYGDEIGQRRR